MTDRPADYEHPVPFTPWATFFASWEWRQGEHITVIGPTGTGKTTVLRALMPKRYAANGAVCVLGTKSVDENLTSWARRDRLTRIESWPPRVGLFRRRPADVIDPNGRRVRWDRRVMLWPDDKKYALGQINAHIAEIHRLALEGMYRQGAWCIVGEELAELHAIGLKPELERIWKQGRSAKVSLVGATQRPVGISLDAYSQASHLFMFGDNDEVNLDRLQGIGGMSGRVIKNAVAQLRGHDVLYINTRNRELVRTRVPIRKAG